MGLYSSRTHVSYEEKDLCKGLALVMEHNVCLLSPSPVIRLHIHSFSNKAAVCLVCLKKIMHHETVIVAEH